MRRLSADLVFRFPLLARIGLLAAATVVLVAQSVFALITGGEGSEPIRDPGWPAGAAAIFNHPGRLAWWEGPPFGGGQWHAECRGDAKTLSEVLADFAKLDAKTKRVVVHDGVGRSFWLNPNSEPDKAEAAKIDWIFAVWIPASWERIREFPASLSPIKPSEASGEPPSQIDVYAGGNIRWADVVVPPGLDVIDERLEAHGFTLADGTVLEGNVIDLATKQPIASRVELQRIEPQSAGGYKYTSVANINADARGHWVLKNAPQGRHQIVVSADGYVPRVVGYEQFDTEPRWQSHNTGLSRPASVAGTVTDRTGQPLADVEVRLDVVVNEADGRYQSPHEYTAKTDADGRFRIDHAPIGSTRVWVHKPGYVRPRLGLEITTPKEDVELTMLRSSQLRVTVDFSKATRPEGYIIELEPESGSVVGSWGGSANIDASNQYSFKDVPPGRYILKGRPNPGAENQQTEPATVVLLGGDTVDVTLQAK